MNWPPSSPRGPAHDDPVEAVGPGVADVLHAEVVLVGEEVRERVVLGLVAQQVLRRRPCRAGWRCPSARPGADGRGPGGRRWRRRPRRTRPRRWSAAGRRCGRRCRPSARRPRPRTRRVRRRRRRAAGRRRSWSPSTSSSTPSSARADGGDLRVRVQVDAVSTVQVGEQRRHLFAEHGEQRLGRGLEEDDLDVVQAGGAGHLETDPAAADDRQAAAGSQRLARAAPSLPTAAGSGPAPRCRRPSRSAARASRWRARGSSTSCRLPQPSPCAARGRSPSPASRCAGRRRGRRTSPRGARGPRTRGPCRAGSPWTAEAARTAGAARRRRRRAGRRTRPRGAR